MFNCMVKNRNSLNITKVGNFFSSPILFYLMFLSILFSILILPFAIIEGNNKKKKNGISIPTEITTAMNERKKKKKKRKKDRIWFRFSLFYHFNLIWFSSFDRFASFFILFCFNLTFLPSFYFITQYIK